MGFTPLQERLTDGIFAGIPVFPVAIFRDLDVAPEDPSSVFSVHPSATAIRLASPIVLGVSGIVPDASAVRLTSPVCLAVMLPTPMAIATKLSTPIISGRSNNNNDDD